MKGVYVDPNNPLTHTNTIEAVFSIFERGMHHLYQHRAKHNLHGCLAEFDFRYSYREATAYNYANRSIAALKGIVGKRLIYRRIDGLAQA